MADKSKEISGLLNDLSLDAYKTEFLSSLGLMDEKDIRLLEKTYCSEVNIPIPPLGSHVSIPFQCLPKMIERLPSFKSQLNFLSQISLPLQIKMLEDGRKITLDNVKDFSIESLQKKVDSLEFKTNMNYRWQVYVSTILNTIFALQDKSFLKKYRNFRSVPDFLRRGKRATYLDTKLRHLLKGTEQYFLKMEEQCR